jgi:hypothetical protein
LGALGVFADVGESRDSLLSDAATR